MIAKALGQTIRKDTTFDFIDLHRPANLKNRIEQRTVLHLSMQAASVEVDLV